MLLLFRFVRNWSLYYYRKSERFRMTKLRMWTQNEACKWTNMKCLCHRVLDIIDISHYSWMRWSLRLFVLFSLAEPPYNLLHIVKLLLHTTWKKSEYIPSQSPQIIVVLDENRERKLQHRSMKKLCSECKYFNFTITEMMTQWIYFKFSIFSQMCRCFYY